MTSVLGVETVERYCLGIVVIVAVPRIFRYWLFMTERVKGAVVWTEEGVVYVRTVNPTVVDLDFSRDDDN